MRSSYRELVWVAAAALCLSGGWGFSEDPKDPIYRLYSSVTPVNYSLMIQPDLDNAVVTGTVTITLQTTSNQNTMDPMNSITLHLGEDSDVNETTVSLMSATTSMTNLSFIYLDDDSMMQVVLPDETSLDFDTMYMLTMDFTSPLYTEPKGLFWGSISSTSQYVASAFRATYARNLFPCFDEPQFQVPLVLQVLRPATHNVTFTTSLQSSIQVDDKMLDTFNPTSDVSLSSLGLFMSEVQPVMAMGVALYAPDGYNTSVDYLDYLISNITTTLGSFPVPDQQLKLVVLPDLIHTSFSSLGFVFTTPEVYLGDVDAELQWMSLRQQLAEAFLQQYLAYTHTPEWWSDLWLSDSLAAYLAMQMLPEPSVLNLDTTLIRCNGMNKDFGSFSGPIVNPDLMARLDIESAIANETIKNKGLSTLVMWHKTLPAGLVLETAMNFTSLKKPLTTTEDFLELMVENLQNDKSFDGAAVIEQIPFWINSTGNPVVSVTSRASNKATITQSSEGSDDVLWPVSISVATASSKKWTDFRQDQWLTSKTMDLKKVKKNQWLVLNLENAPYRVDYGGSYHQLITALTADNSSSIPAGVRASIQSDAIDLALSGSLDFLSALLIMNNTQHDQVDWIPVVRALDTIAALMGNNEWALMDFGMYVQTMFTSELLTALDLTKSADNPDQWLARSLLTPWLCRFEIGNCRDAVAELASLALLEGTTDTVDANDMDNVACLGARYDATYVDNILANYASGMSLHAKRLFTLALGCVIDPASVTKILNTVVENPSQFAVKDIRDIMVGLASNPENSKKMVSFIVSNAETIQDMIGSAHLSDIIKALGKFRTEATMELQSLDSNDVNVDEYVKQSAVATVARVNSSFAWWSEYGQALESALFQKTFSSPSPSTVLLSTTVPTTSATATTGLTGATSTPLPTTTSSAVSTGATLFLIVLALATSLVKQ